MVKYIDYRFKQSEEDLLYKSIIAEYIANIGTGRQGEKRISFIEERNKIYGIKTEKDERTAGEIVADTFKKHGIKIRRKGEEVQ